MSPFLGVILAVLDLVLIGTTILVLVEKRKGWMALWLLTGPGQVVAYASAIRLGRPDSPWADRYDKEKMARAEQRFADDIEVAAAEREEIRDAWTDEDIDPDDLDPVTRRALRRAGKIT